MPKRATARTPQEKYPFSPLFQRKLATYVLMEAPFLLLQGVVRPEYFEDPFLDIILQRASAYLETVDTPTTPAILKDLLEPETSPEDWPFFEKMLSRLARPLSKTDQVYVLSVATDFARTQNYKVVLAQAIEYLKQGNLKSLDQSLERAMVFGKDMSGGLGSHYFQDVEKRLSNRDKPPDVIKSLIRGLDESLGDGGYGRGELHVFAALPSAGKSFALAHLAKVAIIQRKKVVYYTLEMSEAKVSARLDASFSGVLISELRTHRTQVKEEIQKIGRQYGESLVIKQFPAGICRVSDLRTHLYHLRLQGFETDVIIVDYINLLATSGARGQRHRDLGQVYIDLRGLAQHPECWVFTAAQSNRGGYDSALLTMKSLAESFEGAMHADTVVTLNRTDEEAQREYMRLYIAKDRDGIDKRLIPMHTNYSKGSFYRKA